MDLNNLKHEAKKLRLTSHEKSQIRARIFGAPSPLKPHASPYVFLSYFSYHTRMVLAGLLLFVMVGGGTVSAAAGSLPGDTLYGVKLSINEKVEMLMAQDTSSKAALEVRLAERRVEEAQSLAAEGRLESAVAESLGASVEAHVAQAQTLAQESEDAEPGIAAQVEAKLASSLATNSAILKKLGKGNGNKGNSEQSNALAMRVIARAGTAAATQARTALAVDTRSSKASQAGSNTVEAMSFMAADTRVAPEAPDTGSQKKAARLQKKAAEALADAQDRFDDLAKGLDATTTAEVKASLAATAEHMSLGSTALGGGAYSEAEVHFSEVLRTSARLEALLKAQKKFNNNILKDLIKGDEDDDDNEGDESGRAPLEVRVNLGL
jgi:hypothetical protein